MSKEESEFDLEDRLIDFAVHIIRTSESLQKSEENFMIRCSLFDILRFKNIWDSKELQI